MVNIKSHMEEPESIVIEILHGKGNIHFPTAKETKMESNGTFYSIIISDTALKCEDSVYMQKQLNRMGVNSKGFNAISQHIRQLWIDFVPKQGSNASDPNDFKSYSSKTLKQEIADALKNNDMARYASLSDFVRSVHAPTLNALARDSASEHPDFFIMKYMGNYAGYRNLLVNKGYAKRHESMLESAARNL